MSLVSLYSLSIDLFQRATKKLLTDAQKHRPAIANERLKRNRAGQVVLQLKSAFKDGTTHIVMSPLEFMQRLAALVPRPRLHSILLPWRARAERKAAS